MVADLYSVRGRFARSVRLDSDETVDALSGYIPTARSIEVLRRLCRGIVHSDGARAFSVTGPYGSGKSSLAVLIDALLGPSESTAYRTARRILVDHAPDLIGELDRARAAIHAGEQGFVRAVVTAPQREPVTTTVLRALARGARRAEQSELVTHLDKALARAESTKLSSPSFSEVRSIVRRLSAVAPVLLIIDEFGKNLEAFADSGGDGDLYLLQELAESTYGVGRLPLVVMTIQHLAFEAYAADASATQRREWAKVQGRFEDVPFLDSPSATRSLVASALVHTAYPELRQRRLDAASLAAEDAVGRGAPEVAEPDLVAACYPLHPSTLLVLPDLCSRYGQNERTLFSFLASDEPKAAKHLLSTTPADSPLPWVRLDHVYDYFVESASTFVGTSRDATRWIEIETTIRDAHGLTEAQRRVLKTIGIFNLVAAVGTVRASRDMVCFALSTAGAHLEDDADVQARVDELVTLGLVVHRDFADEYRIWQGSDFDLVGALSNARRRTRDRSPAALFGDVFPMSPVVAARHAIHTGTVRAFDRAWTDGSASAPKLPAPASASDGLLLYVVGEEPCVGALPDNPHGIPIVFVQAADTTPVTQAAVEVAALLDVASDPILPREDRAIHRELAERTAQARQVLRESISATFGPDGDWVWANAPDDWKPDRPHPLGTSFLSEVLDAAYPHGWSAGYEAVNRAELTSQGAKARRQVLEALVDPETRPTDRLGFKGDGPEVAIWRAVLSESGLHREGVGITGEPHLPWQPAWRQLIAELKDAVEAPVSVTHLHDVLMLPPHGVRSGIAGLLVVCALIHRARDIAIYEHGTFKPRLDGALVDRLVRNPANFAVKHLDAADPRSTRGRVVASLADALNTDAAVLPVTSALVRLIVKAGKYTRSTRQFHLSWNDSPSAEEQQRVARAAAVRDAIAVANEPDELLFTALPAAVSMAPAVPARHSSPDAVLGRSDVDEFVALVTDAAEIIRDAETRLCDYVGRRILKAARADSGTTLASDAEQVVALDLAAEDVRVFAGQAALASYAETSSVWVTRLATACAGKAPANWTDADVGALTDRLVRLAADFRRVAALANAARGRDADGEAFTAWALSATATDGRHQDTVVAVPHHLESSIQETFNAAVTSLMRVADLPREQALEQLAGALAAELIESAYGRRLRPTDDSVRDLRSDDDADYARDARPHELTEGHQT